MNIAILGFDVEGHASYEYFAAQGHQLTICDQNREIVVPDGVASVLGDDYLDNLDRFDLVVRTAGLAPRKILEKNPGLEPKITTHINEFLRVCPTHNVIGVTGTKGKGTASTLIAKMLEADGKLVRVGGNIGFPPLSFLSELREDAWVVLELSSFQLIDLHYSPRLAVCLMVVPEHLDWHSSTQEYYNAKSQLFHHQTTNDVAIYDARNEVSAMIAAAGAGHKLPYLQAPGAVVSDDRIVIDDAAVCETHELKLLGAHNWENVCAAVTATWQATHNIDAMRAVLTSFSGLEHRLELVREFDGVHYYDDSFGTTPETAMVAIQAFEVPKVIILGGSDKGASYDQLAQTVASGNVRSVVLIGEQADRIRAALQAAGYHQFVVGGNTMSAIVQAARGQAQPGDVVLLSTACASFDMFKNYKDRGEQFRAAVLAL